MKSLKTLCLAFALAGVTFVIGCRKDVDSSSSNSSSVATSALASTYSADLTRDWFKLQCSVTKNTAGFFPPQASRAYAYLGLTAYEAAVNGISGAKSLTWSLNGWTPDKAAAIDSKAVYNWAIVTNAALADQMRNMYVGSKISTDDANAIDALEKKYLEILSVNVSSDIIKASVAYGKAVAASVYDYSKKDGGDKAYLDAFQGNPALPTGDDKWVPTNPKLPFPIAPKWGTNRLMLPQNSLMQPVSPVAFSTAKESKFYQEAQAVYTQVKNTNSIEEVEIVKFWADDPFSTCTPTGHTFNLMSQFLEENRSTLETAAVAYAKLGIAENDAFICCWKTKYQYNLIRPVSYIQKYIDPTFTTVIGTPAFPAYTSGHATEGAAASRIFTKMFTKGDGYYQFTDRTNLQFGQSVRTYRNFDEAAAECALSRFYGGIHYNMDNLNGLKMGKAIGDNVNVYVSWPSKYQ